MAKVRSSYDGTQSIERAILLIRLLATRGHFGWGLSELAVASGLKKTTTHRILSRLERERLVHRRDANDRFFLGAGLGELALSISGFQPFVQEAQQLVRELSRDLELIVVFALRNEDHFVLVARSAATGHKGEINEVGSRRPLISTAGGLGMLIAMDDAEQHRIVESNRIQLLLRGRANIEDYLAMWRRSRKLGHGANFGDITPGVNAVAVPIRAKDGTPFGSIGAGGPEAQLPPARASQLAGVLRAVAGRLAELASRLKPDIYGCLDNGTDK